MRRWWFALFLCFALPLPGLTQTVPFASTVRSGEHGDFTRLAFRVPDGASWTARGSGETRSVTFGNTVFNFNLSEVFRRIDRSRLRRLAPSTDKNGLELTLACDCDLRVFRDSQSYVVVDIVTSSGVERGFALPSSELAGAPYYFRGFLPDTGKQRLSFDLSVPVAETADPEEPERVPGPGDSALPVSAFSDPEDGSGGTLPLPLAIRSEKENRELEVLEGILLGQITHAADQGLLETVSELSPDENGPAETAEQGDNYSIVTSVDREVLKLTPNGELLAGVDVCSRTGDLDLSAWETDEDAGTRLGRARSEIFGEFDQIDPNALRDLMLTYLFFGFGAEARAAIQLAPGAAPDEKYLLGLADIFDGNRPLTVNPFAGAHQCDSSAALWAVLAAEEIPDGTDKESVLRFFSALPPHLRKQLGPDVSNLFVAAGDPSSAAAILRAVTRSGVEDSPGIALAEAGIATLKEDHETAREKLAEAVVSGEEHSAEALVRLVDEHWRSREPLAPDVPDLAAAYALELRDDALGPELRQAEVVALSLTGSFPEAFDRIMSLRSVDGRAQQTRALSRFMVALAAYSDDVTFLRYALGQAEAAAFPVEADVVLPVADRLLALGFPGQSRDLIERLQAEERVGNDGSLLLARSAIALELPHRAMIDLLGNDSAEADHLRARALWRNGKIAEAAELSLQAGDGENAWRGYWHSGQKKNEADPGDGFYQRLSALSGQIGDAAADPLDVTPLAQARALLQGSESVREQIEDLRAQLKP